MRRNTSPALATRGSVSEFSFGVNEQPNSNRPFLGSQDGAALGQRGGAP